jgi:hypothetical protein
MKLGNKLDFDSSFLVRFKQIKMFIVLCVFEEMGKFLAFLVPNSQNSACRFLLSLLSQNEERPHTVFAESPSNRRIRAAVRELISL